MVVHVSAVNKTLNYGRDPMDKTRNPIMPPVSKREGKRLSELERDQRKHVLGRIKALSSALPRYFEERTAKKEPAKVSAARALIKEYDDERSTARMIAYSQGKAVVRRLEEELLFKDPAAMLPELRRLEALVNRPAEV